MIREVYDLTPDERDAHAQKYGHFNNFPPHWREVDEAEITTKALCRVYSPILIEYRQMGTLVPGAPPLLPATLYYFHDGSGHAIHYDTRNKRVRWFRFELCDHTYAEISRPAGNRSGEHTNRCTQCGYTYSYDTSD